MSAPPALLAEYARIAEPRLAAFLDEKGRTLAALPVDLRPAHALLRDYVLRGGKRLRGALVVLGCEAGAGPRETALDASIGVELLHAYLLIHDDFMDRDEVRRGGPTLHVSLARDPHLAASLAVLLGSLCEAWALELVLRSPVRPDRALSAGRLLASALQEVIVGQALDLSAPQGPPLSSRGVGELQRLKTGSYTFELPLKLGALLAGAPADVLDALSAYARPLGQAFQIADDLLGTFGAPAITGKPNASDLREGKRTLLVTRALEAASAADATLLRASLGRADMTDAQADEVRAVLVRSGAAESSRREAEALCAQAIAALDAGAIPAPVASALRDLAAYSIHRAL